MDIYVFYYEERMVFREREISPLVNPELLENVPRDAITPQMLQYKIQIYTWLCSRLFEVLYLVSF
jgi:hypothetical protein